MSHYQVLASPSHLQGPYLSMKTSGNHLWWHLWAKKWPCFIGEKFPKIESKFKVGVLERKFAFFGLKPNDIKQRSWFWPKIPISDGLTQLDWRHLENQNKSKKCTFLLENIQVNGPEIFYLWIFLPGLVIQAIPKTKQGNFWIRIFSMK